jgi:hypothetical protein
LAQRYTATNSRRTLQDVDERIQRLTQPSGIHPVAEFGHDWSIALVVVNAGHPVETLETMLANYSPRYAAMSTTTRERWAKTLWAKAVDHVHARPARSQNDVSAELAERRDALERQQWAGKAGLSELAVLRALYSVAISAGATTFTASVRQLAEKAGRQTQAVKSALHRLQTSGHVQLVREGRGHRASTWHLSPITPLEPRTLVEQGGRLMG